MISDPAIQKESSIYIGIDINDEAKIEKANELFKEMTFNDNMSTLFSS